MEVVPVEAEESLYPWSDVISYQDLHASLPFQGVVGFYDVQKELIKDLLPHLRNLMDNPGFEGGGTCSPACLEPVEHVM